MNLSIFAEWLKKFDRKMASQKCNILLLLDNDPSHILPPLKIIRVHFLPPMTTSHLEPLNAGIIYAFKRRYRQQQLRHIIKRIDAKESHHLLISDIIRFVSHAWDSVIATTINNC